MIVELRNHRLTLQVGDITRQRVDMIVNAANAMLAGGGGVDGAIHRAAGPSVMEETRRRFPEGCPPGHAVLTSAGRLSCRLIAHAVGPIWKGGHQGEPAALARVHEACLRLAVDNDCRTIAFPAISTGAYGYPIDLAAEVALRSILKTLIELESAEGLFVDVLLFDRPAYAAYSRVLEQILTERTRQNMPPGLFCPPSPDQTP